MILYYDKNTKDKHLKKLIQKYENAKTKNEKYISEDNLKFYLFKEMLKGK